VIGRASNNKFGGKLAAKGDIMKTLACMLCLGLGCLLSAGCSNSATTGSSEADTGASTDAGLSQSKSSRGTTPRHTGDSTDTGKGKADTGGSARGSGPRTWAVPGNGEADTGGSTDTGNGKADTGEPTGSSATPEESMVGKWTGTIKCSHKETLNADRGLTTGSWEHEDTLVLKHGGSASISQKLSVKVKNDPSAIVKNDARRALCITTGTNEGTMNGSAKAEVTVQWHKYGAYHIKFRFTYLNKPSPWVKSTTVSVLLDDGRVVENTTKMRDGPTTIDFFFDGKGKPGERRLTGSQTINLLPQTWSPVYPETKPIKRPSTHEGVNNLTVSWKLTKWDYDPKRLLKDSRLNPMFVAAAHRCLEAAVDSGLLPRVHQAYRSVKESDDRNKEYNEYIKDPKKWEKAHPGKDKPHRAGAGWKSCHNYGLAMDVYLYDEKEKWIVPGGQGATPGWYSEYQRLAAACSDFVWGANFDDADHFEFHPAWKGGADGPFLLRVKKWAQNAAASGPDANNWMPFFWWAAGAGGSPPPASFLAKNPPPLGKR
jgi:hypothetical protein